MVNVMDKTKFYDQVKDRMLRYAKGDSQAQPYSGHWPTADKQRDLAVVLRDEMINIGVSDVFLDDDKCVVYGRIPGNMPEGAGRAVGFIAHIDTAPDASGTNVKP